MSGGFSSNGRGRDRAKPANRHGGGQAPPIADYGLIGDCHGSALVSRAGSIDWCCLPRLDSGSCFGRLLDWERGGFCAISLGEPEAPGHATATNGSQAYVPETMVLETVLECPSGSLAVHDFFAMRDGGALDPRRELVRIARCTRGSVDVAVEVAPRFDYGVVRPWLRRVSADTFTAIGGDAGLVVWSDASTEIECESLCARATLHAGERLRLAMRFVRPHLIEERARAQIGPEEIDAHLQETVDWWRAWRERLQVGEPDDYGLVRSAMVLKALSYAPTGAMAAAATTSLPEAKGGKRNWDYRFSWIRDSTLAAYALAELGCQAEAARFRHFIVRSSAGHAEDLQVLYGIGGERRTTEQELEMAGYRGARPVRAGNDAARQLQLDAYGEVLNLGWRWHLRGHSPDDDEWRFFCELVEAAIDRWRMPDHGIWEWRGKPRHFVHSKAACWAAVDRGVRLAQECVRRAPLRRWRAAEREIRSEIEKRGYDERRGVFVQCFDERPLDCAALLLPVVGFVEWQDERMVRTADAIHKELGLEGFVRRYKRADELPGTEGAFLACSFWLAECYARQGRAAQARELFDEAMTAANHVGLFSEEFDPRSGEMLGNVPQALSHLSHISACVAVSQMAEGAERRDGLPSQILHGSSTVQEDRR
jgi:GH15 family glucan-1,4-alpha-glucosidase